MMTSAQPAGPPVILGQEGSAPSLVVFHLDEQRFALRLSIVERVVPMVEVTLLPRAPDIVVGVINIEGEVIAVLDIRARFALPQRAPTLTDHLLVARTALRPVALAVDAVAGVAEAPHITSATQITDAPYLAGVARLDDGLVLIHDLDTFLSSAESKTLDAALAVVREP